ncbi:uncharacterized protein LOC135840743 [Planococcus citri]|uniref:uncharacterized protein LOC135840743 n=1 Tax=Planococcus citri TaxID=170843 RepID=UPI0031F868A2
MKARSLIFLIAFYCLKAENVSSSNPHVNDKIEERIIDVITHFSSSYRKYMEINLSLMQSSDPKDLPNIKLDPTNFTLHTSYTITPKYNFQNEILDSTLIRCDSSKQTKIDVKLKDDIEITANVKITNATNSSSQGSNSVSDTLGEGTITLTLRDNYFSKQFSIRNDDSRSTAYDVSSKMVSGKTEVFLDIQNEKFRQLVHTKSETLFDQVKSPMNKILSNTLKRKLNEEGISIPEICSKVSNQNEISKKLNDLEYIVQNVKFDFDGVPSKDGFISMYGLSSINNTEFTVTNKMGGMVNLTIKLETKNLEGKVNWNLKNAPASIFVIDFIRFEVQEKVNDPCDQYSNDWDHFSMIDEQNNKVKVHVGNLRFNSTTNSNALNAHLKTVIADKLKKSLAKKVQISCRANF